jgi:ZIP family zinc transporter
VPVILTALGVGGATVIGALLGFLFKKPSHKANDLILSFAAGVMLAASVIGLILPSLECGGKISILITVAGIFCGAFCLNILDRIVPHLHRLAGTDQENHPSQTAQLNKVLLFVIAIAIHNLPEGIAAGVGFGGGNTGEALTIAAGIALQNIPEAMVSIVPLLTVGITVKRTLLIAVSIGAISILSMLVGFGFVFLVHGLLSLFLGLAGGAMLYVVSDEMIPETHSHGYEKPATFSLIAGFMLIMLLQQLLP